MSSAYTYFTYPTAHGPLTLSAHQSLLSEVVFGEVVLQGERVSTAVTNEAASEIQEYLAGKRFEFTVPFEIVGSDFQRNVLKIVCDIPYGHVATAKDIAEALGRSEAFRSVGSVLRANKLAPIIPTHRIVDSSGEAISDLFHGLQLIEARNLS